MTLGGKPMDSMCQGITLHVNASIHPLAPVDRFEAKVSAESLDAVLNA